MASLKLNTASGGSVTITPTDTAQNYTVSLPVTANSSLLTTTELDAQVAAKIGVTIQGYDANTAKYNAATANFTGTLQKSGSNVLVATDIGTSVQAYDPDLTNWAGKTTPAGDAVGTTDSQTLSNKTLTSPVINTPTISSATFNDGYTEESVTANTSTAYTINLANGTVQILTLTGNCTYTFPTPAAGKSFTLVQKQDGTGSRTVTWDSNVKWPASTAPTITSAASKADVFSFMSDGTYWYGRTIGQNYL